MTDRLVTDRLVIGRLVRRTPTHRVDTRRLTSNDGAAAKNRLGEDRVCQQRLSVVGRCCIAHHLWKRWTRRYRLSVPTICVGLATWGFGWHLCKALWSGQCQL